MTLFGLQICPSPLMTEAVTEVRRVHGGYLNRWLIRQVVTETRPSRAFIHDRVNNVVYCHPAVLAQLQKAAASWSLP